MSKNKIKRCKDCKFFEEARYAGRGLSTNTPIYFCPKTSCRISYGNFKIQYLPIEIGLIDSMTEACPYFVQKEEVKL